MKNIVIRPALLMTFFHLLFSCSLFAQQIKVSNLNLIQPDTALLYIGVDNYLKIDGIDPKAMRIYVSGASIIYIGPGEYNIKVIDPGFYKVPGFDTVKITTNRRLICQKVYHAVRLPDPLLRLAKLDSQMTPDELYKPSVKMTVDEVVENPTLDIVFSGCFYRNSFTITKYTAYVIHADKSPVETFAGTGGTLSDSCIAAVKKLKIGDVISIDDVHATIDIKGSDFNWKDVAMLSYAIIIK